MQRKLGLIAAAALALPVASHAEFNYSFVELKYMESEIEIGRFDLDGEGFALRGSLEVHPSFFVFAEFADMEYDFGVDGETWTIGGGGHWPLNTNWDLVGKLSLQSQEVGNDDEDALVVAGGVRGAVTPQLEVDALLEYADYDIEPLDGLFLTGEGRYNFTPQLAAGLFLRLGDDFTGFGISGRFSF